MAHLTRKQRVYLEALEIGMILRPRHFEAVKAALADLDNANDYVAGARRIANEARSVAELHKVDLVCTRMQVEELREAVVAALEFIDALGEHSPIVMGGEAEVAAQLRMALESAGAQKAAESTVPRCPDCGSWNYETFTDNGDDRAYTCHRCGKRWCP